MGHLYESIRVFGQSVSVSELTLPSASAVFVPRFQLHISLLVVDLGKLLYKSFTGKIDL